MPALKPRLLCVDDDAQCLAVRRILFEAHGFEVITTTSPRQALRLYRLRRFAAAVIDFQMPDVDGGVLAREMKSIRPDVPVVILSGLPYPPEDTPQFYDLFLCKTESGFKVVKQIHELIANPNGNGRGRGTRIHERIFTITGIAVGMAAEGLSEVKDKIRHGSRHFRLKAAALH